MNAAKKGGMKGAVNESMRSLLERRTTLHEWLAKLDDLESAYRTEITDRVRADYKTRLGEVAGELEDHRGAIESSLGERRMIHDELGRHLASTSAELEEAELRFQIGEFDEVTWESRQAEHTDTLEAIQAEQDEAATAVQEMEAVLADIDGGGSPRNTPGTSPEPVAELEPEDEPVTEPEIEREPVAAEAAVSEAVGGEASDGAKDRDEFLDELEFLESLSLEDKDSFDAVSRMLEDEETTGDGNTGRADS